MSFAYSLLASVPTPTTASVRTCRNQETVYSLNTACRFFVPVGIWDRRAAVRLQTELQVKKHRCRVQDAGLGGSRACSCYTRARQAGQTRSSQDGRQECLVQTFEMRARRVLTAVEAAATTAIWLSCCSTWAGIELRPAPEFGWVHIVVCQQPHLMHRHTRLAKFHDSCTFWGRMQGRMLSHTSLCRCLRR